MVKVHHISCDQCEHGEKSVFCDLSRNHLNELDSAKTVNTHPARQVIFAEGDHPQGVYCVTSGKVKVYKMDTEGHQQIVRLAGPGDLLGYRCLMSDSAYAATAETIEETTLCFVDKVTFLRLLTTHPKTAFNVMAVLATDLERAETQITNLVHKNVRERLAELLLLLHSKYGPQKSSIAPIDIFLTRGEMAELIGTTQESVIRLITEFRGDGMIDVDGRKITLRNIPRLIETANLVD